jgi:hypothetical protein
MVAALVVGTSTVRVPTHVQTTRRRASMSTRCDFFFFFFYNLNLSRNLIPFALIYRAMPHALLCIALQDGHLNMIYHL